MSITQQVACLYTAQFDGQDGADEHFLLPPFCLLTVYFADWTQFLPMQQISP